MAKLTAETGRAGSGPVSRRIACLARTVQTPAANEEPASAVARREAQIPTRRRPSKPPNGGERVPEIPQWWFAFQSQGASGGPWIGPAVEETLDAIAAEGVKTLMLQPIGFLCDHVEILYDVDILFRGYAGKLGMRLERPESLNASTTLAKAVADLAHQGVARLDSSGSNSEAPGWSTG